MIEKYNGPKPTLEKTVVWKVERQQKITDEVIKEP
jgi:hypothetical protein